MKNIVIFDLDGTLADCRHRLHFINPPVSRTSSKPLPKDWKSFFEACPNDDIIEHAAAVFYMFRKNPAYEIWVVSGRSDSVKAQTEKWLLDHHLHPDKLIMRPAAEHMDDDVLKAMWVTSGVIPKERVMMAFDDRDRVVAAWRKLGIPCFQVSEGDF